MAVVMTRLGERPPLELMITGAWGWIWAVVLLGFAIECARGRGGR